MIGRKVTLTSLNINTYQCSAKRSENFTEGKFGILGLWRLLDDNCINVSDNVDNVFLIIVLNSVSMPKKDIGEFPGVTEYRHSMLNYVVKLHQRIMAR